MNINHVGGKNHYFIHMGGLTHFLTPLLRKKVYENQFKIKKSYDEFAGQQVEEDNAPTRTKNCFFLHEHSDVLSYSLDCLIFSLVSLSLDEKITESTDLRMNPFKIGGNDTIINEKKLCDRPATHEREWEHKNKATKGQKRLCNCVPSGHTRKYI